MKIGDFVEVVDEASHWYHCKGRIVDLTRAGMVVLDLRGERGVFDPHQVDDVRPFPEWHVAA